MEYYELIQRAIDYIELNLTGGISIEEVAREARLSRPHLYKVFPIVAGCTVGQYIRRRRLSCSADALKRGRRRVIDVALDYQYDSQESYIRAFKAEFGVTPGAYMKSPDRVLPLYGALRLNTAKEKGAISIAPDIILKQFILVGAECKIDLSRNFSGAMADIRSMLRSNLRSIQNKVEPARMIGVWLPDPDGAGDEMSARRVYYTGVEVARAEGVPANLIASTFPESLFARFREAARGTMSRYAYSEWLPESGYLLNFDALPGDFEIFDDMERCGESDACDILLPIQACGQTPLWMEVFKNDGEAAGADR